MLVRATKWEDLDAVVELLGAQNRAASGVAGVRAEHLRSEWKVPGFVLGRDNLVVEEAGRLVGYGAVTIRQELVLAAAGDVVADELLERLSARARELGFGSLTLTVLSEASPLAGFAERHPFRLDRVTLLMRRPLGKPLPERLPPEGIAIRTFEPADAESVHRLLDDSYLAWDARYVPMAHDAWVSWMIGDSEFDPRVWWIAERSGELAGCALHWNSGWLKDIAVSAAERGRGLGAALVGQGLSEFSRRGVATVGLKVDASNPTGAVRLYERLGFSTVGTETIWLLPL
ncbi:MAG TPA: GNAT family N-acetyltransferase [Gaiellaceae bacterium]|nr:GNAT family N-acetyltransferase [Gaiellaceae bacterium]